MIRTNRRLGRTRAIVAALAVAALLVACGNAADEHRLHVLQEDPVLRCRVHGMHLMSALGIAGSKDGIGFGGITSTEISRRYRLNGEFQSTADRLSACASAAGWKVNLNPVWNPNFLVVEGHKRMHDGWDASLNIYVGHDVERQPSVLITIDTDPV